MKPSHFQIFSFSFIQILASVFGFGDTEEEGDRFWATDQEQESGQLLFYNLKQYGVLFTPTVFTSSGWDVAGGRHRTTDGNLEYLLDVNLQLESEKLVHFSGGVFCVDFQMRRGGHPSNDVGSYEPLLYIESSNVTQLGEFWYKQSFNKEHYWIKIGKNDCSRNFDYSQNAAYFQYQSFQNIPTIRDLPYYPNSAMGIVAYAQPIEPLGLTMGLFDGSAVLGVETGSLGITGNFFDHLHDHAFMIMEIDTGWSVSSRWTGRLGIGAWHNTAHVPRHNGRIAKGLQGGYLLIDQTVWKSDVANDPRQIGLFIQIGATSPQTSDVKQVYATGMNWTGPIPSRAQDQFGIGIAMNRFSLVKGSGFIKPTETAIETYYVYQPFSWMNIQPDLQYIITPGGSDTPNALAVFLNMVVIF